MNFFQFGETKRIVIADDFWKFVILWLTLTILTGIVFFIVYMRSRYSSMSLGKRKGLRRVKEEKGEV